MIHHPSPDAQPIALTMGRDRILAIARGLCGAEPDVIRHAGLSLRPAPLGTGLLDRASGSATKPGGPLKRAVLRAQHNWLWHRLGDPAKLLFLWNGTKGHRMLAAEAARARGHAVLFLEEAPLPGRITADFSGVNAGGSLPRDIRAYTAWAARHPAIDWRAVKGDIRARASARKDVGQEAGTPEGNYLFCPLQVPGDSQITVYGGWIDSIPHLIRALHTASRALPDGWHLRIKEHPSARQAMGDLLGGLTDDRFRVDNTTDTMAQLAGARGVVTVNSSVGVESMFHDKPVIVLGRAFYGLPEIVTLAPSQEALTDALRAPEALGFDLPAREAFMSYLVGAYFPREEDIVAGRVTLDDLIARDQEMAVILSTL